MYGFHLLDGIVVTGIHHMHNQIGVFDFFQGGAESLYQFVRKFIDETYGIGQSVGTTIRSFCLPYRGIQGGK